MSASTDKKPYETLRSFQWFGKSDLRSFGHRSRAMQIGHDPKVCDAASKSVGNGM